MKLHNLYPSLNIRVIKPTRMRWAGHVARIREIRNTYKILVGRPMRRWEDNIRMDLREITWEFVDWIQLA
jgi:hypothetical protein